MHIRKSAAASTSLDDVDDGNMGDESKFRRSRTRSATLMLLVAAAAAVLLFGPLLLIRDRPYVTTAVTAAAAPPSDPNGQAAGVAFLAENSLKPGVIALPSGLQYKVLREGGGLEHPKVGTPCECHYAGRLLDGTEFDSSYKRGKPSTFAPNQVIRGWTEAM